jgi:hypothetical protein
MTSYKTVRIAGLVGAFALAGALSACGGREAESHTATSEAEVSTDLPPEQVSEAQLKAAAEAAAHAAAGGGEAAPADAAATPTEPAAPAGAN